MAKKIYTDIKRCSDCGRFLSIEKFNFYRKEKNFRMAMCKTCQSNRKYFWHIDNKERVKQYRQENKDRDREKKKEWINNNRDKYRISQQQTENKRRALKLNARPKWVNDEEINEIIKLSQMLGASVDHIFPLVNKNFCGLDVPWNLQIISKTENSKKNNKDPRDYYGDEVYYKIFEEGLKELLCY